MAQEMIVTWEPEQELFIEFLSAGKKDTNGKRWTMEEYAKLRNIGVATLYRWQQLPGFKQAVFERSLGRTVGYIPQMIDAMIVKTIKQRDVGAFMAMMRQYELLKSDKVDTKTEHSGEVSFTNQVPIQ